MTGRKRHFSHKTYVEIIYVSLKHLLPCFPKSAEVPSAWVRVWAEGTLQLRGLLLLPRHTKEWEAAAVQGSVCSEAASCAAQSQQVLHAKLPACLELGTGMNSQES